MGRIGSRSLRNSARKAIKKPGWNAFESQVQVEVEVRSRCTHQGRGVCHAHKLGSVYNHTGANTRWLITRSKMQPKSESSSLSILCDLITDCVDGGLVKEYTPVTVWQTRKSLAFICQDRRPSIS